MLKSIGFCNLKVLKNTVLPLGPVTLVVGPNGSGKTTALDAFRVTRQPGNYSFQQLSSVALNGAPGTKVEIALSWDDPPGTTTNVSWSEAGFHGIRHYNQQGKVEGETATSLTQRLNSIRVFGLDAGPIADQVTLQPRMELHETGHGLAGVVDRLRDEDPERFKALNEELGRLLPEFDQILFETPAAGARGIALRTRKGQYRIRAIDLSQGTLLALALLTVAHLPSPPPLVAIEEPDRGIHPRLLRELQTVVYRLAYPQDHGESRGPVQVVMTTHSPYFLDLFRDHPEEIVLAEKQGLQATFSPLTERPDIEEILANAPLGEVWYSGVLGGVPSQP